MTVSDEILLDQVADLQAAEALWRTRREVRAEFKTASLLWHYVSARRMGLVRLSG